MFEKNAGRPSRAARHRNYRMLRLFVMRILFLGAATFVVLAIAAGLVAALLILPIALRVTLLMLLTVVLMLIVAALTRILVGSAGWGCSDVVRYSSLSLLTG